MIDNELDLYIRRGPHQGWVAYLDGARVDTPAARAAMPILIALFRRGNLWTKPTLYAEAAVRDWPPTKADLLRAEDAGAMAQPVNPNPLLDAVRRDGGEEE